LKQPGWLRLEAGGLAVARELTCGGVKLKAPKVEATGMARSMHSIPSNTSSFEENLHLSSYKHYPQAILISIGWNSDQNAE
jgi:hypothetical protein